MVPNHRSPASPSAKQASILLVLVDQMAKITNRLKSRHVTTGVKQTCDDLIQRIAVIVLDLSEIVSKEST